MKRPSAAVLAALALWAGWGWGCAYPALRPLEFLDPQSESGGTAPLRTARIAARVGPEWIEIDVHNGGEAPLMVDWEGSTFVTPGGHEHRLISAAQLSEHALQIPAMDMAALALAASGAPGPWTHDVSPALQQLPPARLLVAPGRQATTVLYPAEHVVLGPFGFHARPLFCTGEGGDHPFDIVLRVAEGGFWRDVRLRVKVTDGG